LTFQVDFYVKKEKRNNRYFIREQSHDKREVRKVNIRITIFLQYMPKHTMTCQRCVLIQVV